MPAPLCLYLIPFGSWVELGGYQEWVWLLILQIPPPKVSTQPPSSVIVVPGTAGPIWQLCCTRISMSIYSTESLGPWGPSSLAQKCALLNLLAALGPMTP